MKSLRYMVEAFVLHGLFGLMRLLPVRVASALGGFLARTIGPHLAASRKALQNLANATPCPPNPKRIVVDMWDNLGRVAAEYPHLSTIVEDRLEVHGQDILDDLLARECGGIFISAHMANWEILIPAAQKRLGVEVALTYRRPNNPRAAQLLEKARADAGITLALPKGRKTGPRLIETLKNHGYVGMLVDQKYNGGLAVPFFGRPAMTNPVFVRLAQKYNVPIVPVQVERVAHARFRITVHPPIEVSQGEAAIAQALHHIHNLLEAWILAHPAQWLWLHKRWGRHT